MTSCADKGRQTKNKDSKSTKNGATLNQTQRSVLQKDKKRDWRSTLCRPVRGHGQGKAKRSGSEKSKGNGVGKWDNVSIRRTAGAKKMMGGSADDGFEEFWVGKKKDVWGFGLGKKKTGETAKGKWRVRER